MSDDTNHTEPKLQERNRILSRLKVEAEDFHRIARKWEPNDPLGREHEFVGCVLDRIAGEIERGEHCV